MPLPRDDHTAVIYDGREMIVFGGFVDGSERTNDVYIYNLKENKWEKV
jgi:N-acetylneuraminic acid mutarotase